MENWLEFSRKCFLTRAIVKVLIARRLGCDPDQATLDVKLMGIKVFPKFRGTHVFVHACYLVLQ